jgi:tRNA dimethylallyltransferase
MPTRKLIAVVGPTASGKTVLAIDLALSHGCEIVNADSRQIYRYMDIGTAKPTPEERSLVPHHLIDIVDPDSPFSLGQWLDLAKQSLDDVWRRGLFPLVVGGTGQYVWALLEGWRVPRVEPDAEIRDKLSASDPSDLLAELRRVDPEAESFIDPRNVRRVIRALEVYRATGKPLTHWRSKTPPDFDALILGVAVARDELYRRIDARVDAMVDDGLSGEVQALLDRGYTSNLPSMSSIGYREFCQHLAGETTLAHAVERTKTGTHRLARHQNAWFKRSDARICWVAGPDQAGALVAEFLARDTPL